MGGNVYFAKFRGAGSSGQDSGGGPPDNGDMEARVQKLEAVTEKISDRLGVIEKDVAVIKAQIPAMATKEDVQKAVSDLRKDLNEQTWKFIGASALLATVAFWAAKNLS